MQKKKSRSQTMKYAHLLLLLSVLISSCDKDENLFNDDKPPTCIAFTQKEKFDCLLDSLDYAEASDIEKINTIRKFVAQRVDIGNERDTILSPFDALEGFANNTVMARCTYASKIYVQLLQYAGYTAYGYQCGYPGEFGGTHYFVLVDLNGSLIIQDAFYNATFSQDYITILSLLQSGQYNAVGLEEEMVVNEMWFTQAQFDSSALLYGQNFGTIVAIDTIGGRSRILLQHNYTSFTQSQLTLLSPLLQSDNLPVNFYSLYRKPIAVYDVNGVRNDSILSFIQSQPL